MRARVLHVVPDLVPYGLENIVAYLACEIDRERFEPAVLSLYGAKGGGLESTFEKRGVRVFHLGKRPGFDVRMFSRFARALRQIQPHILHTHNYVLRYTYFPALRQRIPVQVHTVHNVAHREVDYGGRILQRAAFRCGVVPVAIADEVSATIRQVYGLADSPMIPNGIPVVNYQLGAARGREWRTREGFAQDDILCVCVGRFVTQKDHATLLRAFALGPASRPGVRLLLAGEGNLLPEIEREIAELGMGSQVRILGRRTDIPDVLSAADLFVSSSRWEGNPLAVMEAMASGVPVVGTTVGGVPELVEDGKSGLLVPPGEPGPMAAAISRLLNDAVLRAAMGRAATARALEKFDAPLMVRAYERLYRRLLAARGQPVFQETAEADPCTP